MSKSRGREEKLRQKKAERRKKKKLGNVTTPTNLWGVFWPFFTIKLGKNDIFGYKGTHHWSRWGLPQKNVPDEEVVQNRFLGGVSFVRFSSPLLFQAPLAFSVPKCPNLEKPISLDIFNLAWKRQSRLKISIYAFRNPHNT